MPTPVSALIHAATMVTAGVYLLIRSSPLIEYSSTVLLLCLWLGAITTVFSSLIGLFQQDIKKVIAYSTMSQLAQKYTDHLSIFRHQTIYENIIYCLIYYFIICTLVGLKKNKSLFFLGGEAASLTEGYPQVSASQRRPKLIINNLFRFFVNINFLILNGLISSFKLNTNYKRVLHQDAKKNFLNPYYLTGFVDGEGCFLINIYPKSNYKAGYLVSLTFKLKIHSKDINLLENIQNYFNVGNITYRKDGYVEFIVSSIKDIKVLIDHFDSYPLLTQKWADYQIFKQTFIIINLKEHLTKEGVNKILSLKAVFNNGLSDSLKKAFPDLIPAIRPKTPSPKIIDPAKKIRFFFDGSSWGADPNWVSGFVDAEGCFFIRLSNTLTSASLVFKVAQHIRDVKLLEEFINYFNCGYSKLSTTTGGEFVVTKFSDLNQKIIPFFKEYPILGLKYLDFKDFVKASEIIQNKAHLTKEGINEIQQIKSRMNRGRSINMGHSVDLLSSVDKKYYSTMSCAINSEPKILKENNEKSFKEWLAGLIDGRGKFFVSKKGYANFSIVLPEKDKSILYIIKHKYGGSIKSISGSNSFKYKLHHKKGLISLVLDINGLIRNPVKILQLNKVCILYNINLEPNNPLTYNNGWFSGILDADGSIIINETSNQLIIGITQKNKYLLDPLNKLYLGRINIFSTKEAFQYVIYRKKEILDLVDNYFIKYPLKSSKAYKLNLIKDFYQKAPPLIKSGEGYINQPDKFYEWINFKNKWDKL